MSTDTATQMVLTSTAFEAEAFIPIQYSCEGGESSPPLTITGIPPGAASLAIIAEDPDAPKGVFDHWIVWNIPVTDSIPENATVGVAGMNSAGRQGYRGPCPPSGTHRYYFNLYALDTNLQLTADAGKKALQDAMKNHVLASATLMARYKKQENK